jgi:glycosyltransferase involved in cell wall biosynthesis
MPPVYLILSLHEIGGAEKRFAGLWQHLRAQGEVDVRLVVPSALHELLLAMDEFREGLRLHAHAVSVFEGRGRWSLARHLRALHASEPGAVFHFVMDSPAIAQWFVSRRTLFSLPQSSLAQLNRRGRAVTYAGVLRARRIDVLDPRVHQGLIRRFVHKRGAFSLTPNSFVDLDAYQPGPKSNLLAFCGIFTEEKQAFRLLDVLPEVDARLAQRGIRERAWVFLGYDVPPGDLVARAEALRSKADVRAYYAPNPQQVLARAKVFFSLQRANNYPSKSLLEAMACGCLPIVTDVGESRRIAPESIAAYVPRDFTADDIARQALAILSMDEASREAKVEAARAMLAERFSIGSMARYFVGLYEELARL